MLNNSKLNNMVLSSETHYCEEFGENIMYLSEKHRKTLEKAFGFHENNGKMKTNL